MSDLSISATISGLFVVYITHLFFKMSDLLDLRLDICQTPHV
jgi:hypothetical protein